MEGDAAKIEVNVEGGATVRKSLEFKIDPAHGKERRPDQSMKGDDSEEKGSKWKDLTGSGLEALIS